MIIKMFLLKFSATGKCLRRNSR